MPSAVDHLEFGPPKSRGSLRALILAVLAHLLLIAALTWGVNWKKSDDSASSFAAELWPSNSSPQEAAPIQPMPRVVPPSPTPVAVAPPPPPPRAEDKPLLPQVDIALEEEKKRKVQLQKQREQLAKEKAKEKAQEKERLLAEQEKQEEIEKAQRKAQLAKAEKVEKVRDAAKKAQLAQEAKEIQDTKEAKVKDAAKRQAQVAEKAAEEQRQQNMKRLTGMAGATGETEGKSSNRASAGGSGSSTTYGAIVRAAIKPNVVFTDEIVGNPMAKVEVRLALDGMIISQRLVQSSGNKNWDDAALNAIIRTRVMPRDVDGRIPDTTLILEMKPRG